MSLNAIATMVETLYSLSAPQNTPIYQSKFFDLCCLKALRYGANFTRKYLESPLDGSTENSEVDI